MTVISLIILFLLSYFVHYDYFRHWDYLSMVLLQKISNPLIDYVFSIFTLLGSTEISLIIISTIFLALYFRKKKLIFSVYLYILIYPLELLGKLLIYHPKPPLFFNRYVFDFHLPSSFIIETSYSYPSGHMARSAFIVGLLFYLLKKSGLNKNKKITFSILLFSYLSIMFVSRIYLGEHWFSDVLGGSLLGFIIASVTFALW